MIIWKLRDLGGLFTPIKQNMPKNVFWNKFIKHYRNSITIILFGFPSLANQRFIAGNWVPYIFLSVVSAVWAVNCELGFKFYEFRELRVFAITFAGTSLRRFVQNKRSFQNLLPLKITYKRLYSRHVVIVHFLYTGLTVRFSNCRRCMDNKIGKLLT